MLVGEGRLDSTQPPQFPAGSAPDDPRSAITLEHLLEMRDGLDFVEDYVDDRSERRHRDAVRPRRRRRRRVRRRSWRVAPNRARGFNYSSGTTNIVVGHRRPVVGAGEPYEQFLVERLFAPIGMSTATATFDPAGTWIASSYVYCTAQDFARFGYLYLRDGMWDGTRILPEGWVDHARTVKSVEADGISFYGAHWWLHGDEFGTFRCSGYEGQRIVVCPALDLVMVRLGKTDADALRRPARLVRPRHRRVSPRRNSNTGPLR